MKVYSQTGMYDVSSRGSCSFSETWLGLFLEFIKNSLIAPEGRQILRRSLVNSTCPKASSKYLFMTSICLFNSEREFCVEL